MRITRHSVFDPGETGSKNTANTKRHSLVRKAAAALGVAALGVATATAGLAYSAPAAHAIDVSAASMTLLGDNDNNEYTSANSEFRADFVVKAPAGVTIEDVKYSYKPQATAADAIAEATHAMGELTPAEYLKNDTEKYTIEQQVTVGSNTYYAISSHGDSGDVSGPGTYFRAVVVTLSDGSELSLSFEITLTDPAVTPVMPTPWNSGWGGKSSALGTSQDNWGVNTGQSASSSNTDGTAPLDGRFIVGTIDKTANSAECTDQSYQWFDANGKAVGSVQKTGLPSSTNNQPPLGTSSLELTGVPAFTAPGYYKLIGWPCGTGAGTLSEGQQIGSVFHDLLPNVEPPTITAPKDGSVITKKTGSPITISGTLPARDDQRGYSASDKVTVTDDAGNKICDATVVAAAAGKASTWTCDATLKDGDYTITATYTQVSDAPSGLKNVVSAASAPVSFQVDRTAVAPVIVSPEDGSKLKNSPMEITGTASDEMNPPGTVTVMDGETVLCKDLPVAEDGTWTCVLNDPLSVGKHTITAVYTDEVGNVSQAASVTYEVLEPGPGPTITVEPDPNPTVTVQPDPGPTVTVQPVAPTTTTTAAPVVPVDPDDPDVITTPEPLAFTGGSIGGPLALGGGLMGLGAIVYVLARRARAHRRALTA